MGLRLTAARFSQVFENERAWVVFVRGLNDSRRLQSDLTIRGAKRGRARRGLSRKTGRLGAAQKNNFVRPLAITMPQRFHETDYEGAA